MRRRKALGVVFAYEGLQPTSEASDKKLTSGTGKDGYSFTQLGHSSPPEKKTGRPGNPIDPGGKAGAASFRTSRQVREK